MEARRNVVKLQQTTTGKAYMIALPKRLVEAKGYMKGDEFSWQFNKDGNLELVKKKNIIKENIKDNVNSELS